jgi:hypothetical protein
MKLILIHGSKVYFGKPSNKNLTYLIAKKIIGADPTHKYIDELKRYFLKKGLNSEVFHWNASIWLWKIKKEAYKLAELVDEKGVPVVIFAKSNGGVIAQLASAKTNLIKKIVQVGTPNLSKISKLKIPIVNIYCPNDDIQRGGIIINSIFNLSIGSKVLKGRKVKNTILKSKNHRDLNSKNMFKFYYELVKKK